MTDVESGSFIDKIKDDDMLEFTNSLYLEMDEYLKTEMIRFSNPKFMEQMTEYITHIFHHLLFDANLCDDEDYDEIYDYVEDLVEVYLDMYEIPPRSSFNSSNEPCNLIEIAQQIDKLKNMYQPRQKTLEWYKYRYDLITASNIWKVFGTESQKNSLIYEKCKPFNHFKSEYVMNMNVDSSMHWGVKYEPVTIMIYEKIFQTKVADFGCIKHNVYDCIGASPDGINIDQTSDRYGRMLEIKNIFNREITGIPKEEYWIQMQVQMETCDLNECDFMETRFKEYESDAEFYQDEAHEHRGIILYFIQKTVLTTNDIFESINTISNEPMYVYMPLNIPLDYDSVTNWINTVKEERRDTSVLFKTMYWYLDEYSCVFVKRNKLWFQSAIDEIKSTWEIICKERVDGYEHRNVKKRRVEVVSDLGYSSSQLIKNMPISTNICLIKLDENGNQL
jgi:putative phage-type endonuclease